MKLLKRCCSANDIIKDMLPCLPYCSVDTEGFYIPWIYSQYMQQTALNGPLNMTSVGWLRYKIDKLWIFYQQQSNVYEYRSPDCNVACMI